MLATLARELLREGFSPEGGGGQLDFLATTGVGAEEDVTKAL